MVRSKQQTRVLGLVLLLAGCASSRTVQVSAARPAQLLAGSCSICRGAGPCTFTFSRETCWLNDSSSGYLQFQAALPDGRCQILMAETCELKSGERIHLDLSPALLKRGSPCWQQVEGHGPPPPCGKGSGPER